MYSLKIIQLNKRYKNKGALILKDLSLKVESGTAVGIFGRNGSGKSTLFKILFGTLKFNNGTFLIDNQPFLPQTNIQNQHIAFLPQDLFLPLNVRVRDLIPMFYESVELQNKIFHAFQIPKIDGKRVGELSLGMRKYFAFLLSIYLPHPIILLDEPFSMVEPLCKEHIKKIISAQSGLKTIILSDHYYEDVLSITDENYIMKEGKLTKLQSYKDFVKHGYLSTRR